MQNNPGDVVAHAVAKHRPHAALWRSKESYEEKQVKRFFRYMQTCTAAAERIRGVIKHRRKQ